MNAKANGLKIPFEEGKKAFEFLQKLDLRTAEFDEIKKRTNILVRCGFSASQFIPLSPSILRGVCLSIDEIMDGKANVVDRFSYRRNGPESCNKMRYFNRASTNKRDVFYGAIPTAGFSENTNIATVLEISNLKEATFPLNEYEYLGISSWLIKNSFNVASLGMHSEMASRNEWAKDIVKSDIEFCDNIEHGEFVKEVSRFMSSEFSKPVPKESSHLYKISAAYGDSLFDLGIEGIVFPSVQTEGKSFNIALRGDVVDRCLDIEIVAIVRGIKATTTQFFYGWHLVCPRIYSNTIKWEEPPAGSQIAQNDIARYLKINQPEKTTPSQV